MTTTVTITLDPSSDADIQQARAILDRLARDNAAPVDPGATRQKVIALLRGYGAKRTEYIRAVAQAAPGTASYEDVVAIVGSPKAVGGTHSAIERAWRAKGMTTPFISTDINGENSMDADLAEIVLGVIHDLIDEPDPLLASAF